GRGQGLGPPAADPAESRRGAPEHHEEPRPEPVHQPPLEGDQPGLEENEDRERDLDEGLFLPEVGLEWRYEQRPAVLEVRYRHHADHAGDKDEPAVANTRLRPTLHPQSLRP